MGVDDGAFVPILRIHLGVAVLVAQGPVRGFEIDPGNSDLLKSRIIGGGLAILGQIYILDRLQIVSIIASPVHRPVARRRLVFRAVGVGNITGGNAVEVDKEDDIRDFAVTQRGDKGIRAEQACFFRAESNEINGIGRGLVRDQFRHFEQHRHTGSVVVCAEAFIRRVVVRADDDHLGRIAVFDRDDIGRVNCFAILTGGREGLELRAIAHRIEGVHDILPGFNFLRRAGPARADAGQGFEMPAGELSVFAERLP